MAEALYRKYRPQIFEDVVGQEHIERTIKNAIEQDKVSHAYLFTGPRGTGKTTTARLLAKALLCEHGPTPEPDGTCSDCAMIANGEHPDVYELDAASRTGVENVREEIIGRVQFAPTRGRYKVYIIDEVHMLSTAAFNALLKTLEEPPSHVVFILATTDPQKVPETIHSRCQRFDFRRISLEAIVSRLGAICVAEDVEFEGEALDLVAHRAEGGMRNALTSLEQLIAFGEGKVTLDVAERMLGSLDTNDLAEIVRAIGARDVATCFRWTADYVETGADLAQFTRDMAEHIRNMYVLTLTDADVALEIGDAVRRELTEEIPLFGPDRLARLLAVLGDLSAELKTSSNPRLSFEIALTRMVRPDSDLTLLSLAERVEALESGYSAITHVSGAAPTVPSAAASTQGEPAVSAIPPQTSGLTQEASSVQPASEPTFAAHAAGQVSADPAPEPAVAESAAPLAAAQPVPSSAVPHEATAPSSSAAVAQGLSGGAPSAELVANLQNPASLQRMWQAALSALKKNKAAYGVLFLNTKAVYDTNKSMLVIEFPADNTFAFKAVQKPEVQDAVSAALAQACGTSLPFLYTQGSAAANVTPAAGRSGSMPAAVPEVSRATSQPTFAIPAIATSQEAPAASAPVQSANQHIPASTSHQADSDPYDDMVPYDDVVPYGDEAAPSSSLGGFVPPPRDAGSATINSQPSDERALAPLSHSQNVSTGASVSDQSCDDIAAILAAGFGEGIKLEEV